MVLNIIINESNVKEVAPMADKCHDILRGNDDYIDSNIVLNFNNTQEPQVLTIFCDKDRLKNPEEFLNKIKEMLEIYIVNIV